VPTPSVRAFSFPTYLAERPKSINFIEASGLSDVKRIFSNLRSLEMKGKRMNKGVSHVDQ
jgi:hypothetical protein